MRRLKIPLVIALLLVVCSFHGTPRAGPGPKPKAVDLLVVSDGVFVPGSAAAVRVMTRAVTSMADSRPLAGAQVRIALLDKKKEHQLFSGRTDGKGALEAGVRLPRRAVRKAKPAAAYVSSRR
jgi:hypothetical protein